MPSEGVEAGGGQALSSRAVGASGGVWLRGGHARVLLGPVRSWGLPLSLLWRTWARWQHALVLLRW